MNWPQFAHRYHRKMTITGESAAPGSVEAGAAATWSRIQCPQLPDGILSEAAWLCGRCNSTRRLRGDSNETCLCHWCCSGPGKWRNGDATFRTDIEAQRSKSCWGPELLFGSRMLPAWMCSIWATKICDVMIYELLDSWRFLDATEKILDLLNMGCLIFSYAVINPPLEEIHGESCPRQIQGKETLGNRFGHMILKKIKRSRWAVANGKRVIYVSFEQLISGSTAVGIVLICSKGCVWKCCVPHCTQWFCWSLSLLNGYFIGNIPYFQTNPKGSPAQVSPFQ